MDWIPLIGDWSPLLSLPLLAFLAAALLAWIAMSGLVVLQLLRLALFPERPYESSQDDW